MNIAEKYVYEVYRKKSFTDAAKSMFVSQPALSSTISKHESKLGYNIFNRKTSPVTLTREGEIYIEYLEESMEIEQQFKRRLNSLHSISSNSLSIGGSNSAALLAIPILCREFSQRFPDVVINIDVGETAEFNNLFDKLDKGSLDVVVTSNVYSPKYDSVTLWRESYLLIMRRDYPGVEKLSEHFLTYDEILSGKYPRDKEIADYEFFKYINIFKPGTNRKGWKIFSSFFAENSCNKFHISSFRRLDMHYELMAQGLGGAMLPQSTIIKNGYDPNKLCCFAVAADNNLREVMIVYKKDSPLTQCAKDFLDVAQNNFSLNFFDYLPD